MADLQSLLTRPTVADITDTIVRLLATAKWPLTAWQPGSVARTLVSIIARPIADLGESITAIAKGGYLDTAAGDWLTLLADSRYDVQRWTAQACQTSVVLTDTANSGPHTFAAGILGVGNASLNYFSNTASVTVPKNGQVTAVVKASEVGAAWNAVASSISVIKFGGVAGLTVASSPVPTSSVPGTDDEDDESLRVRCRKRWSTLATMGTAGALEYYATSIGPSITRAWSTAVNGAVTVYCAGPPNSLGPSDTDLVNVGLVLQGEKRPICASVTVVAAPLYPLNLRVNCLVKTAYLTTAQLKAMEAYQNYIASVPVGGTVHISKVIGCFTGQIGVVRAVVTVGGTTVSQGYTLSIPAGNVAQCDFSLNSVVFGVTS